ncbi:cellulase family glycosylhydrolase [bacterium]|nr:cellulase family glycosylhydrolase [bacterium]
MAAIQQSTSPHRLGAYCALFWLGLCAAVGYGRERPGWIEVSPDRAGFVIAGTTQTYVPWGFNYNMDRDARLLEDYWTVEWATVEEDFREMAALGANVARVHLQLGKFMRTPTRPDRAQLRRLARLVDLAERTGVYLDVTGLGCYLRKDVPGWYDALSERDRWAVQARFWQAIARVCKDSPAIFCYDLMNEPVVPGGRRQDGEWLGPPFGGQHFVQFITLDQAGRPRPEIARAWIEHLVAAVREVDRRHLITVGLVDWSLDRPGMTSGFVPEKVAGALDFLCVHLYPERGKVDEALETLRGFAVGKPVVIEETFPLRCGQDEFERFLLGSRGMAGGWIGFYWGETPAELRRSHEIGDAMMLGWLELFQKHAGGPRR